MPEVYIIHGLSGHPETGWKPWLKQELEKRGYVVHIPALPNTTRPTQAEWVKFITTLITNPSADTYLVGHSLGCITILRFLESLPVEVKFGGVIFLAGFTKDIRNPLVNDFLKDPIDWGKIKQHCGQFVDIQSDDDPIVSVEQSKIFKEKLGAKLIIEHDQGHYSSAEGTTEVPTLLAEILRISQ